MIISAPASMALGKSQKVLDRFGNFTPNRTLPYANQYKRERSQLIHHITFINEITANKRTCCALCIGKARPWGHFTRRRTDHPGPRAPAPRAPPQLLRSAKPSQARRQNRASFPLTLSLPRDPASALVPSGPLLGQASPPPHPRTRARGRAYATWLAMASGAAGQRGWAPEAGRTGGT